jgi:hypothetical protein
MAEPVHENMDTPLYISLFSENITKIAHLQKYQHFKSGNTVSFQKFFDGFSNSFVYNYNSLFSIREHIVLLLE